MEKQPLKIGFIGAGKVGTAFGIYLRQRGIPIEGYYSRSPGPSQQAAGLTLSKAYSDGPALAQAVDLLFITTGDSEIKRVCDILAENRAFRAGQTVVHMSGALSSSVLQSAGDQGCHIYSLHPIQSFADIHKAVSELTHTVFSIEGVRGKHTVLEELLKETGNRCFHIKPDDKVLYHAAACIFSNYMTTLLEEGLQYLQHIGINAKEGMAAMLPLIAGTLSNIENLHTDAALTGPIARGDADTVKSHLDAIACKLPDKLPLYLQMAEGTLALASRKKLKDPEKIEALNRIIARHKAFRPV